MVLFRSYRRLQNVFIIFFLSASLLHARAQGDEPLFPLWDERTDNSLIPNDPDLHYGVLDNGLTYYVKQNSTPEGFAQLKLIVKAGSLQEDDDQLGLAHFLEHMLFNGTEKYPEHELLKKLESFGMHIGPDVNATTSFTNTYYDLIVSTEDEEQLDTGLDILKEWAFNARLDEEEVEQERGVIHEEWRQGRGFWARITDKINSVIFKGSRYADRLAIGDMEVIRDAPVSALKRYYRDWYRPNLMAVIAVGDFDPDMTVKKITDLFGNHPNPPNFRPRIVYPLPENDETYNNVIADEEATNAFNLLYVTFNSGTKSQLESFREDLATSLFIKMLSGRLEEVIRLEDPPFHDYHVFVENLDLNIALAGMQVMVEEDKALRGMDALMTEVERIRRHGFLQSEFERSKLDFLTLFKQKWIQQDKMESSSIIEDLSTAYLLDSPFPSMDWKWKTLQNMMPQITLDEVEEFASMFFQDSKRFIIGPSVPAITDIETEEIDEIIQNVREKEVAAWEENLITGSLVEIVPKPGRIISRVTLPGTNIVNLKLSNGANVYYKVTDFEPNTVKFSSFSHGGNSIASDENFISAKFSSQIIPGGGLGNYSQMDIDKLLSGKLAYLSSYINRMSQGMTGQSSSEDLETLFQLIYLQHTMPKRDEKVWASAVKSIQTYLKNRLSDPMTHFSDAISNTVFDGHYRMMPDTIERMEKFNIEDAYTFYKQRFRYGGNFSYIFVGDFNPKLLETLSVQWLASLPAPPSTDMWRDNKVRISKKSQNLVIKAGKEPVSQVFQSWSGVWDGSYKEEYRLTSLASALQMRLFEILREESGGTYSVYVYPNLIWFPTTEFLFEIGYGCAPERVEDLSAQVLEIIKEWRTNPPEERFAESVAMNQHNTLDQDIETNDWWLNQIIFVLQTGWDYKEMLSVRELFNSLSSDVLRDTAARYLDDTTYTRIILLPEE